MFFGARFGVLEWFWTLQLCFLNSCVFFPPHSLHDFATTVLSGFCVFSGFVPPTLPPRFPVDDFEHLVDGLDGLIYGFR